jgi:hypothetical protein
MIRLPKTIEVLSQEYDIVRLPQEELDGNYGTVEYDLMEVRLAKELDGDVLRETLLHEVLHIIDYSTGGAEGQLKERDIHRISQVLFDTFQKNPVLVKRIFKVR